MNKIASELINSNDLTFLMKPQNYCGIILVDGKYVSVKEAKGTLRGGKSRTKKGLVVISFVDYLTHDIPVYIIAASENMHDIEQGFRRLKEMGYPLKAVVCDESMGEIMRVAKKVYPDVVIQICLTHYSNNLDRTLKVNSAKIKIASLEKKLAHLGKSILIPLHKYDREKARILSNQLADLEHEYTYLIVIQKIIQKIFWTAKTEEEVNELEDELRMAMKHMNLKKYPHAQKIRECYRNYCKKREYIIASIKHPDLDIPRTTNLIEGFHSTSLEIRFASVRGFEHEVTACHYINALILRRRFWKFTDCKNKFKPLNGKCPLQIAKPKNFFGFVFHAQNWIHFCRNLKRKK